MLFLSIQVLFFIFKKDPTLTFLRPQLWNRWFTACTVGSWRSVTILDRLCHFLCLAISAAQSESLFFYAFWVVWFFLGICVQWLPYKCLSNFCIIPTGHCVSNWDLFSWNPKPPKMKQFCVSFTAVVSLSECGRRLQQSPWSYGGRLSDAWQMSLPPPPTQSRRLVPEWNHIVDNLLLRCHVFPRCHGDGRRAGHSAVSKLCYGDLCVWICWFFFSFYLFLFAATSRPPRGQNLERRPSLLLCISLELINSLGLYDWGDRFGTMNPIQLIRS